MWTTTREKILNLVMRTMEILAKLYCYVAVSYTYLCSTVPRVRANFCFFPMEIETKEFFSFD